MHSAKGFTLIEVAITAAIIALLAAVAFPVAEMAVRREKEQQLRTALWQIRSALDAYKAAVDEGHILRQAGDFGYPASLTVLVEGVDDAKSADANRPKLYFLRRVPRDPMNSQTGLSPEQTWGLRSYASSADNPKPGKDVYDVYSLASGNGLNGIPYREW